MRGDHNVEAGVGQLFIDDVLIDSTNNLERVVNQPDKYEQSPVLAPDQVWESQEGLLYPTGCVAYDDDEKLFKMWYQVVNYSWTESMLAYAVSEDGLEWHKPDTGFMYSLAKRLGAESTNIVLAASGHTFDWPIVWRDVQEADERKRYKLAYGMPYAVLRGLDKTFFAGTGSQAFGMAVGFSHDGQHWDLHPGNPVLSFEGEAPYALLREPRSGKQVCYLRLWAHPDHPTHLTALGQGGVRVIGRTESDDFLRWTTPSVCLGWDEDDPELNRHIYNMEVMEYESLYIGFLSMYHVSGVPSVGRQHGIGHDEMRDDIPGYDTVDVQLAVSRDTWSWQRVGNETWTEVGGPGTFMGLGEEEAFDCAMLYPLQAPLVVGDEIWIYYTGMQDLHWSTRRGEPQRGAIGLARLKRDRFVAMQPGPSNESGTLTTVPLSLGGRQLTVNADASVGGLEVELLDTAGEGLPGFGREQCGTIREDGISIPVRWGEDRASQLGSAPLRLRFHLDWAKLYSFATT